MHSFKATALLATLVSALPAPPICSVPPLSDAEFTIVMQIPWTAGTWVPLKAGQNGADTWRTIVAGEPATPAYTIGSNVVNDFNYTALAFDDAGISWGLSAFMPGSSYGVVTSVLATQNYTEQQWLVSPTGFIEHERTAAWQTFFACNQTLNGEPVTTLSFGMPLREASAPVGCGYTQVYKAGTQPAGPRN